MDKKIVLYENYGPFKKNVEYSPYREGRDWYQVRNRGTNYYIGKYLVNKNPRKHEVVKEEEDYYFDEDDDFLDEYFSY